MFHNNYDETITYVYSGFQNKYFSLNKGNNVINFKLQNFQLSSKIIRIKGRILIGEIEADWPKDNLVVFSVEQGLFYENFTPLEIDVPLLIKGVWTC
jgi:hypothetical protein